MSLHHPVPGKPDEHQKADKKQDKLIKGHEGKNKYVRFFENPHHTD